MPSLQLGKLRHKNQTQTFAWPRKPAGNQPAAYERRTCLLPRGFFSVSVDKRKCGAQMPKISETGCTSIAARVWGEGSPNFDLRQGLWEMGVDRWGLRVLAKVWRPWLEPCKIVIIPRARSWHQIRIEKKCQVQSLSRIPSRIWAGWVWNVEAFCRKWNMILPVDIDRNDVRKTLACKTEMLTYGTARYVGLNRNVKRHET